MSSDSPIKYLITGATGGLGASIIGTLLTIVPASDIAISSSSPSNAESLLAKFPGTQFRVADYDKPETLDAAFAGVEKLFFVSGNDFMKIVSQHGNVVEAAKKARIGHTYYSSQAFGGSGAASAGNFLQGFHTATEGMLKSSGIPYSSLRLTLYAEAFPRILTWYPNTTTLYLPLSPSGPLNGRISLASRTELGEGIARLLAAHPPRSFTSTGNIALLTGASAISISEIATIANTASGKGLEIVEVDEAEWAAKMAEEDGNARRGGAPKPFFNHWLGLLRCIALGEAEAVDPLLEELLGRKPRGAEEVVRECVIGAGEGGYFWPARKKRTFNVCPSKMSRLLL